MIFQRLLNSGILQSLISGTLVLLLLLSFTLQVHAEQIEAKLQNGLAISASFHKGNPSGTALLLLHGFLQTGDSEPMNSLSANLASRGYTTLAPTLSLRINRRKQSSHCESMHTHTVEQDLAEIDFWFNWLWAGGYKKVVLIGFSSTGNIESLLYSEKKQNPALKHLILVSINPVLSSHNVPGKEDRQKISGNIQRVNTPQLFSLGYCKRNYAATPASYTSFAAYDDNRTLELIKRSRMPLDLIFGSADTILPDNWITRIDSLKSSAAITIIPEANHFFDGTFEFDLSEKVEAILRQQAARS